MIDSLTRSRVLNSSDSVEITRDLDQGERKKKRVPDMAVGVALIVLGIVGSMAVYRSASQTVSVVGASNNLERGHVIEIGDLQALYVSPESAQYFVSARRCRTTDRKVNVGCSGKRNAAVGKHGQLFVAAWELTKLLPRQLFQLEISQQTWQPMTECDLFLRQTP
jgi:hypothetical protein